MKLKLFRHNFIAILYINFKLLPFKKAIKFPIDIYGKVRFENLCGKIVIIGNVRRGMFKIGGQGSDMFNGTPVIIDLKGQIIIKGNVSVGCGILLRIEKNGCLEFGKNVVIGAMSMLFCEKYIEIGDNTITSWHCQIMDTDTHHIIDLSSNTVNTMCETIRIGCKCWIGNHVLINKGTVLPDYTIVSASSLCNKDYSKLIEPKSIIGGIPAKLLAENKMMVEN